MSMPNRSTVINANQAIVRGNDRKPTRLPDGEVTFRIPDADWAPLMRLVPELNHPDNAVRLDAWKQFRHSPLAAPYLVVRSPARVKRSTR